MKYDVRFSCGHTETVELFGKNADRQRKIAWFEESGLCSKCYAEKNASEMAEAFYAVEMFYGDYKEKFSDCKTKPGSYNRETKTIIVYVPKEEPAEEREAEIIKASAEEAMGRIIIEASDGKIAASTDAARFVEANLRKTLSKSSAKAIVQNKEVFSYDSILSVVLKVSEKK